VVATVQQLADTRGLTLEEVAAHTWANTLNVFGLTEDVILGQSPAAAP
jgi:Tat protein secretion system quality control protein TatD with DNase activity